MDLLSLYDPPAGISVFDAVPGQRRKWRDFLVAPVRGRAKPQHR